VPQYLRDELPLDPAPALSMHDKRIKAAFAMAPGIIKAFGMDQDGLSQLTIPTCITVGARDTQAPPGDNTEFAAKHIPHAELSIIPGDVDHEIFVNECDDEGRDEFSEACIDAQGVDRAAIHHPSARQPSTSSTRISREARETDVRLLATQPSGRFRSLAERDHEASFSLVFALAAAPSSCMVRSSPAAGAEAPNFLSRRFMYLRKR